jgi:hypothetical protein
MHLRFLGATLALFLLGAIGIVMCLGIREIGGDSCAGARSTRSADGLRPFVRPSFADSRTPAL